MIVLGSRFLSLQVLDRRERRPRRRRFASSMAPTAEELRRLWAISKGVGERLLGRPPARWRSTARWGRRRNRPTVARCPESDRRPSLHQLAHGHQLPPLLPKRVNHARERLQRPRLELVQE